jgi:hypothetical protein
MSKIGFSFQKIIFTRDVPLVKKTKQLYVLLVLVECNFVIENIDLWISKGLHDRFALVINFLGIDS